MVELVQTPTGQKSIGDLVRFAGTDAVIVGAAAITATRDWQGKMVRFSQACTVTIPSTLPEDFSCGWSQESSGQITFVQGAGATLQSAGDLLKSAAQFAIGGMAGMGAGIIRLYGNLSS